MFIVLVFKLVEFYSKDDPENYHSLVKLEERLSMVIVQLFLEAELFKLVEFLYSIYRNFINQLQIYTTYTGINFEMAGNSMVTLWWETKWLLLGLLGKKLWYWNGWTHSAITLGEIVHSHCLYHGLKMYVFMCNLTEYLY